MPRPVHFDMTAEDPDRAVRFYSDVFGWNFQKWDGPMEYWMVSTGTNGEPGIDGGLSRRNGQNNGLVNTIQVPSADEYSRKIERAGGKVTMPKAPIPGVGWFVSCIDTEGNAIGLMQFDPQAA